MKRIITIVILSLLTIAAYGQKFHQDGIIKNIARDGDELYRLIMLPYPDGSGFEVNVEDVQFKDGYVARIYYRPESEYWWLKYAKDSIIAYFEFNLGLRNLAPGNVSTCVYRTKYYEYRISNRGIIIEAI